MSRAAVIGGGYGGMAAAARLAKQGHEVTLYEAGERLGGALGTLERDGFSWDTGPAHTLLPAVVRDLFRKTGRPLDQELARSGGSSGLDLVPVEPAQRHHFRDGSVLDLPGGSRGDQVAALDAAFGVGAGAMWGGYTHEFADAWADLRTDWLERVWSAEYASTRTRQLLSSRYTLAKIARTALRDDRLRELATGWAVLEGHDPTEVPAWAGMTSYVEQRFGTWTLPGGMGRLADVLAGRLATRRVSVHTGVAVEDLVVTDGCVRAVRTSAGEDAFDVVVAAIDPRRLPALARQVERTMSTLPPAVMHLGLTEALPGQPHETVLHGDPFLVVRTQGTSWTVLGRGRGSEDLLEALAERGLDVRDRVAVRVDRSPRDLAEAWRGSPHGVRWQGARTLRRRLGTVTPVAGVYCAGAHTTPGAGLHYVGLSAALVAQAVGDAR